MWTRLGVFAGGFLCVLSSGCSSCESEKTKQVASAVASVSAAPSVEPPPPPIAPTRRSLERREELEPAPWVEGRAALLEAVEATGAALAGEEPKSALEIIAPHAKAAPLGSVVQLLLSRAAMEQGDAARSARAARRALYGAVGRSDLMADAWSALGTAEQAAGHRAEALAAHQAALALEPKRGESKRRVESLLADAGAVGPVKEESALATFSAKDAHAVCAAIEAHLKEPATPLVTAEAGKVDCAPDALLELGTPKLDRAIAFRVDLPGTPSTRLVYVALESAEGVTVTPPLAVVYDLDETGVVNDVIVDLQRIDVLRGGTPEIVVKMTERRTVPDAVLNEVLELERTRVVLLTVDRGRLEASQELYLSESVLRRALDPSDKKIPKGYARLRGLGKAAAYRMKVAWSGPNAITLTRATGDAKPRGEGVIQLFPE